MLHKRMNLWFSKKSLLFRTVANPVIQQWGCDNLLCGQNSQKLFVCVLVRKAYIHNKGKGKGQFLKTSLSFIFVQGEQL